MLKTTLAVLLPFLVLFSNGSDQLLNGTLNTVRDENNGTLEKMIVADGSVSIDLNMSKLGGRKGTTSVRFDSEKNAFFTVLVFNDELRGPTPGTMALIPQNSADLPAKLNDSIGQLMLEVKPWSEGGELAVSDSKTGYEFFTIDGSTYEYSAEAKNLSFNNGRLMPTKQFATDLGRPSIAGTPVGTISMSATMRTIEVSTVQNGEVKSESLTSVAPESGSVPGPDVIVGDVNGLAQFGSQQGTQVGLSLGTDSCNFGVVNLDWFAMPDNDHPVIPQNMYRMSGGASNNERFEQIGQSAVKHAFTALANNICSLGCNGTSGTHLGSGCSDPYTASLNSGPSLGSRAWINPFTGFFPRGDSATNPNNHTGHGDSNNLPGHRMRVEVTDLNTSLNPGATYYAEGQYVTPHEYTWCQAHPTECNMNNNVSYRQYNVNGTASPFSFSSAGATQRQKPAIAAWPGATLTQIQPAPGVDGVATLAYKVTNTSAGVWHYEYALYNQNLDRAIQSFGVPVGSGVVVSNIGFHAPPQQPGTTNDGTAFDAGFSATPWLSSQSGGMLTWGTDTFFANANANAIRWGTLYNFRFDSNRPPVNALAVVGFYKTGDPITVMTQVPEAVNVSAVSISGRVTNQGGQGVGSVQLILTDSNNAVVGITLTSSFGYYSFANLTPGTYTISASTKRYSIDPHTYNASADITDGDIIAN